MKPEGKVPSLELCKKLFELGITKDVETYFTWTRTCSLSGIKSNWFISNVTSRFQYENSPMSEYDKEPENIPAPDLSELCELFPDGVFIHKYIMTTICYVPDPMDKGIRITKDRTIDALATLLIEHKNKQLKKE